MNTQSNGSQVFSIEQDRQIGERMERWRDGDLSPDGGIWLAERAGAALCVPAIRTPQTMSISGSSRSHTQAAQHGARNH